MGINQRLLIPALLLVFLLPMPVRAGKQGCLACHGSHYVERGKCVSCHRGEDRTDRKAVAHDGLIPGRFAWFTIRGSQPLERGKKLLDGFACRRCHAVDNKGNRLASNLDGILLRRLPLEIAAAIETPVRFMPDFRLGKRDVTDLVNVILAETPPSMAKRGETPLVVHFADDGKGTENIFEKWCGGCHRMLTEKYGGLGRGDAGPNLSGFLTPFYPKTLRDHERWNVEELRRWLENPRRLRNNARMPPIPIRGEEFGRLAEIMK